MICVGYVYWQLVPEPSQIACNFCLRLIRLFHVRFFENELSVDLRKATLNNFLKVGQFL